MATRTELRERLDDIDQILATGLSSTSGDGESQSFDLAELRRERRRIRVALGMERRRPRLFGFRHGACILFLLGSLMSNAFGFTTDVSAANNDATLSDLFRNYGATGDTYDALRNDGKRKRSSGYVSHEDSILTPQRRKQLSSNSQDLHRNLILVAWMIRRHLDFVTKFRFRSNTGDDGLDREVNDLIAREQTRRRCDFGQRHPWQRLRRIAEVRKVLDGDVGFAKIRGGFVQGFEGHQVRNPTSARRDRRQWRGGIKLGPGERALAYCFHGVDPVTGRKTEQIRRASDVMFMAEYQGRMQQTRGASPVFAALNDARDLYETFDLVRERIKIEQVFGVGFVRDPDSEAFDDDLDLGDGNGDDVSDALLPGETIDEAIDRQKRKSYDIGNGVLGFDLDTGEDMKILEGKTPSRNAIDFLELQIAIVCKALDIPFSFFDESFTNFHGALRAWQLYERSCDDKREGQQELNDEWTRFKMFRLTAPRSLGGTGELVLPASMSLSDLRFKWVPTGMPWWKPETELKTDILAVAAGLKTWQDVCDERDLGSWRENIVRRAAEDKFARKAGATVLFNPKQLPVSITFSQDNAA